MRKDLTLWPNAEQHLAKCQPDVPVMYFSPAELQAQARRFQQHFPGLVTYAVKANDQPEVLDNLAAAGLTAFDVASPSEMAAVRRAAPEAVLHYHNPVRSRDEIAEGLRYGIRSWSVDCMRELEKLDAAPRENTEIAVRLRLPVSGAAYDFGSKFGADPDECVRLLHGAEAMGFAPALTFHPGTQCADPGAWATYITASAEVARRAGVRLRRLNVGGGFASHRSGDMPDLLAIFARIEAETRRAFGPDAPPLVCEPGRAMVAEAFDLGVRVKGLRGNGAVFLNDGIYGALTEFRDVGQNERIDVLRDGRVLSGPRSPRMIFGPTCDSLDILPDPVLLPDALEEGDYILFRGMGAYTHVIATRFNGYGPGAAVTVSARSGQAG